MIIEPVLLSICNSSIRVNDANFLDENWYNDWHIHREYEILISLGITKVVSVNKKEYLLEKGDIIFINENVPHKSYATSAGNEFWIQVDPDFCSEFHAIRSHKLLNYLENEAALFKYGTAENSEIKDCLCEIMREHKAKNASYELFIKAMVYKIFGILYRNGVLTEKNLKNKEIERILPVLDYTEKNYASKITLKDMAKLLNITQQHLCKIFKQATGISFLEYLNYYRVCCAEKLIISTDKSIAQVAEEVGFTSASYFTETFKKMLSRPPTYYRKSGALTRNNISDK